MTPFTNVNAQTVLEYNFCYDYASSTLEPIGEGRYIFPYTEKIGIRIKLDNPSDVRYTVKWYEPNDSVQAYKTSSNLHVIEKTGESWGIIFDSLNIAETTASNKLGVWTVKFYIDGDETVNTQFLIIDYANIQTAFENLEDQIEDVIDQKDELVAQNQELRTQLESLQADYAALEAQVGTSSDYEELQDNYDDLQEDYESLKASQATTKMMLYASIVVALVAVVVAVYFGVLKK